MMMMMMHRSWPIVLGALLATARAGDLDAVAVGEPLLDGINLEQSIAAVLQKVAYGSTTKRSIPDAAYPVTTLATPLLTTYRYSDGADEYLRVDVARARLDYEEAEGAAGGYGSDLEKDHALPTSAPAADILRNHHNAHYDNPNRHRHEQMAPTPPPPPPPSDARTTTPGAPARNVRPTKSIYSKDVPSYVPPSRAFFTPPLPPEYLNPFADKPTLRGTSSDGFVNRRPIPPPSLVPGGKERIPIRPDLPPSKAINAERAASEQQQQQLVHAAAAAAAAADDRKKSLNTPSAERVGDFYGLKRAHALNESTAGFEYEKVYIPSITRILSGSNGRHDDAIPDVLLRSATAAPPARPTPPVEEERTEQQPAAAAPPPPPDDVVQPPAPPAPPPPTTQSSELSRSVANVTRAARSDDEVWVVAWSVHVYLAVLCYALLAACAICQLVRYERAARMFSRPYFLAIHLLLTAVCVLRIFYLSYDAYNAARSFNAPLYDLLHHLPLSLLATAFAVLILFLLKHTLTHLRVRARPVFLVLFGLLHAALCVAASALDALGLGLAERASLVLCRTLFVLLAWALGVSYLYLYKIIASVLAKKGSGGGGGGGANPSMSDECAARTSYASHLAIAVALLFVLLGGVQLYALFFIQVDRFDGALKHHWILWSFELSVRLIEVCIITLLVAVVSLRLSSREKQTGAAAGGGAAGGGLQLFPCAAASETSSGDNMYPNNCSSNPNALTYSRQEMALDGDALPNGQAAAAAAAAGDADFERFERPAWGSERLERASTSSRSTSNGKGSGYETASAKYYAPKHQVPAAAAVAGENPYSEPVEQHAYERTRHEFERGDADRRSRASSSTSGRRSTTGRSRKAHARPHLGVQTLPSHGGGAPQLTETMIVDEQGFVRFRHLQDLEYNERAAHARHHPHHAHHHHQQQQPQRHHHIRDDLSHYSDA